MKLWIKIVIALAAIGGMVALSIWFVGRASALVTPPPDDGVIRLDPVIITLDD